MHEDSNREVGISVPLFRLTGVGGFCSWAQLRLDRANEELRGFTTWVWDETIGKCGWGREAYWPSKQVVSV